MENYHLDWTRHEDCDILFTFDGRAWHGKLIGDNCYGYRGDKVQSLKFMLTVTNYILWTRLDIELVNWFGVLQNSIVFTNSPEWANKLSGRAHSFTPSRSGVRSPLRPLSIIMIQFHYEVPLVHTN